ncbi:hypothetical protein W97_06823 [Coniosporium apollinis CBS 100218]|uniref:Uncharacterized protein n=1 Tax=Coniosporium apollinis (strain CBS 100218) TaxID=1168221 RepID=R7Z0G0_CONA1|nr:uncharacterized protein W97_06823 [Coniosporium apollinis CBS 100218]EON67680.1 hypothetical protein W97_06823 [Coniosporium apollinis CBS 100218]
MNEQVRTRVEKDIIVVMYTAGVMEAEDYMDLWDLIYELPHMADDFDESVSDGFHADGASQPGGSDNSNDSGESGGSGEREEPNGLDGSKEFDQFTPFDVPETSDEFHGSYEPDD